MINSTLTKTKTVSGHVVEFKAELSYSEITVDFTVDGKYDSLDDNQQHPAICRFIIECFNQAVKWAEENEAILAFVAWGGSHAELRIKAYKKYSNLVRDGVYYYIPGYTGNRYCKVTKLVAIVSKSSKISSLTNEEVKAEINRVSLILRNDKYSSPAEEVELREVLNDLFKESSRRNLW